MTAWLISYPTILGVLKVGQEIEVRPGLVSKDSEGKLTCKPIRSKIVSLFAEQNDLMYAVPGGLIGVGTKVSIIFVGNSVADRLGNRIKLNEYPFAGY